MKSLAKFAACSLALAVLVGCDGPKEHVDEGYQGVPKNGQSCKEFYKLPANQAKCVNQEGRGGQ